MHPALTDQDFNQDIVRGLHVRFRVDVVSVRQFGMATAPDPELLVLAVAEGRILLTHDVRTMPKYVYAMQQEGLPAPNVVVVPKRLGLREAIDDLAIVLAATQPGESWTTPILYLPL